MSNNYEALQTLKSGKHFFYKLILININAIVLVHLILHHSLAHV